jgi:hypothetical protein
MVGMQARAQSQLLGKGFIAQNIDFDAIADSSVGGNGLPRPYGRFIAHREGNGLSMWQRLPNARHDPMAQHFGPPPFTEPLPSERNVTHMNILVRNAIPTQYINTSLPWSHSLIL